MVKIKFDNRPELRLFVEIPGNYTWEFMKVVNTTDIMEPKARKIKGILYTILLVFKKVWLLELWRLRVTVSTAQLL